MWDWSSDQIAQLPLETLDERYRCYRLRVPEAESAMLRSLRQFGQISPVVVCLREETPVLVDGFKRLEAARRLPAFKTLSCRRMELDERLAKAAIYGLNRAGRLMHHLEEAWIVYALVRDDGLSQVEAGELLGRHKSWVCRRLALLEKLADPILQDLRLGLISPTMARQLTRLPAGNQVEVLKTARREGLNAAELSGVVDLVLAAATRELKEFILEKPRQALQQARGLPVQGWDPRLSQAGNRVRRQLASLIDQLGRMENWLRHRGRADLTLSDRGPLEPGLTRLARDARAVAELVDDFLLEIRLP